MRRFLAALFTLAGAVAAVVATLRPWQGERTASDLALRDLFGTGDEVGPANLFGSLALPLLAGAIVGLLGMLLRKRFPLVLAFLACLVPTALWAIRASDGAFHVPGVGLGFVCAAGATAAFLLAATGLPGRAAPAAPAEGETPAAGRWSARKPG
ncbi:hypothetical protein CFN78_08730 [Amycolatopsis antarctica]|uniref:Uncharacterized protein n=1 Tax=Amycolatopsis antarctica TaxID=1854586 RepID=A0A263D882_9PSEU|nr:hypothetical protein [Amycolatopsis antarctica]OZM73605.1 hypothetical protein CFN78_08730 [Amycolatopsis antarctica]